MASARSGGAGGERVRKDLRRRQFKEEIERKRETKIEGGKNAGGKGRKIERKPHQEGKKARELFAKYLITILSCRN